MFSTRGDARGNARCGEAAAHNRGFPGCDGDVKEYGMPRPRVRLRSTKEGRPRRGNSGWGPPSQSRARSLRHSPSSHAASGRPRLGAAGRAFPVPGRFTVQRCAAARPLPALLSLPGGSASPAPKARDVSHEALTIAAGRADGPGQRPALPVPGTPLPQRPSFAAPSLALQIHRNSCVCKQRHFGGSRSSRRCLVSPATGTPNEGEGAAWGKEEAAPGPARAVPGSRRPRAALGRFSGRPHRGARRASGRHLARRHSAGPAPLHEPLRAAPGGRRAAERLPAHAPLRPRGRRGRLHGAAAPLFVRGWERPRVPGTAPGSAREGDRERLRAERNRAVRCVLQPGCKACEITHRSLKERLIYRK